MPDAEEIAASAMLLAAVWKERIEAGIASQSLEEAHGILLEQRGMVEALMELFKPYVRGETRDV